VIVGSVTISVASSSNKKLMPLMTFRQLTSIMLSPCGDRASTSQRGLLGEVWSRTKSPLTRSEHFFSVKSVRPYGFDPASQ
jgi:hypothetical protein